MIGSCKKWGTEGHIEESYKSIRTYYKSTNGDRCFYKSSVGGKCTLNGYINCGLNCKKPGCCRRFTRVAIA